MRYRKIKAHMMGEVDLREIWRVEYCEQTIVTFDDIEVQFFDSMFDHCFYESDNRREKDKSILSLNRLEKIYWIKDALSDPEALLKVGWDSKSKSYTKSRRVALVKGNYVVIILLFSEKKARFITAYEVNEAENLEKIKRSPDYGA